jgi:hypothetical protein
VLFFGRSPTMVDLTDACLCPVSKQTALRLSYFFQRDSLLPSSFHYITIINCDVTTNVVGFSTVESVTWCHID